jgi:hypothetical protein
LNRIARKKYWGASVILRSIFVAVFGFVLSARAAQSTNAILDEVRRSFTIGGKPIPPEIFRDMGDGDMADSESIRVTIDVKAAIGSNLYYDEVKPDGSGWVAQRKIDKQAMNGYEEYAYHYVGSTSNGLLVVTASTNGGGSGTFYTLHILDLAATKAYDLDGHVYGRIDVSTLRDIPLDDRWDGYAKISGNRSKSRRRAPAPRTTAGRVRRCASRRGGRERFRLLASYAVRTISPVSSSDLRLERMRGQPPDTAAMNLESSRSIVRAMVSLTASPAGSISNTQRA